MAFVKNTFQVRGKIERKNFSRGRNRKSNKAGIRGGENLAQRIDGGKSENSFFNESFIASMYSVNVPGYFRSLKLAPRNHPFSNWDNLWQLRKLKNELKKKKKKVFRISDETDKRENYGVNICFFLSPYKWQSEFVLVY